MFENTYFTIFSDFQKKCLTFVQSFDISKKRRGHQQKFSPQFFEMSSQLRFGFTLDFYYLLFIIRVIAMVIQLIMALNSL